MRKKVTVSGREVFFRRFGKGKPMFILHGWDVSGQKYLSAARILAQKYQVFLPDLPGFGRSPLPPVPWDVADYAHLVIELAEALRLKSFVLVGHSFGARVAVQIAVDDPARVEKMILTGMPALRRLQSIRQLFYLLAKGGPLLIPHRYREAVRRKFYRLANVQDYAQEPVARRETFLRVIDWDQRHLFGKIGCPVGLIWGKGDRLTPLRVAYFLRKEIPAAELIVVPGTGHRLPYQQPLLFAHLVQEFVES